MGPIRSSFRRPCRAALVALAAALLVLPVLGWARSLEIVPYPITSVWPASVRFLRVDRNFPIRERDESAGYVLFDYTDGPKSCKASLELIRVTDPEGRDATRLAVSIPDLPRRYEQTLLDKLAVKIRDDHGPPAPPPPKPEPPKPEPPKPDAGPFPPQLPVFPFPLPKLAP
jgi:hypothetical protein